MILGHSDCECIVLLLDRGRIPARHCPFCFSGESPRFVELCFLGEPTLCWIERRIPFGGVRFGGDWKKQSVRCGRSAMAYVRSCFLLLVILILVDQLGAQSRDASAPGADAVIPGGYYVAPLNCTMKNSSMVSPTFCTYYDQMNMASQMGNCQPFLTNLDPMPDAGCCDGTNEVAYYRTACICDATFYPPDGINFTRSLQLPGLCGITTDLCTQCPSFLVARTVDYPVSGVEKRSPAAKVAAIVLGAILSVALVVAAIALTITELKKRREEKNAEGVYEATPPGGNF